MITEAPPAERTAPLAINATQVIDTAQVINATQGNVVQPGKATDADVAVQQRHAKRPWGSWTVLQEGAGYKVKMIDVLPGHRLSLHYHYNRSEHWVVVAGKARIIIGQQRYDMHLMQSVLIPARTIHRIENPYTDVLQIVEVQRGDRLDEDDIVRLEDDYQRMHPAGGIKL